jgi:hypothetical protein
MWDVYDKDNAIYAREHETGAVTELVKVPTGLFETPRVKLIIKSDGVHMTKVS